MKYIKLIIPIFFLMSCRRIEERGYLKQDLKLIAENINGIWLNKNGDSTLFYLEKSDNADEYNGVFSSNYESTKDGFKITRTCQPTFHLYKINNKVMITLKGMMTSDETEILLLNENVLIMNNDNKFTKIRSLNFK
jgi:hypothetical protein